MSPIDYIVSFLTISGVATALFVCPWYCISKLCPNLSFSTNLLALFGAYSFTFYLKSKGLGLWMLPLILNFVLILSYGIAGDRVAWVRRISRREIVPLLCIILYSFLVFLFRWEPSGSDPVKWGALARIIEELGTVPGDTRPITEVSELRGGTLGIPILAALLHLGHFVHWERALNFLSCLSVALFIFGLSNGLRLWFERQASLWGAFLSLILFTVPQQYLTWGGTPTLLGATAGFILLEFARCLREPMVRWLDVLVFSLALAFAAYAHPIGFLVSSLVCLPVAFISAIGKTPVRVVIYFFILISISTVFFLPFFRNIDFGVGTGELLQVRRWQQAMAPILFRSEGTHLYNLYIQISSYVWNTAFWLSVALFALALIKGSHKLVIPYTCMVAILIVLLENVRTWWLPLSFLMYPDRVATLFVLPLSLSFAWTCQWVLHTPGRARSIAWIGIPIVIILAGHQFQKHLLPLMFKSTFSPDTRAAILEVSTLVPKDDCIQIGDGAGKWIPVLSFRCTIPFHGLGMNSVEEETSGRRPRWRFETERGKRILFSNEKVVFDNGVRLIQLSEGDG